MKITLPSQSKLRTRQFTYGVATASFQIEGGADSRLPCIWDTFCATADKIADNSDGKVACDHFHRWQQDIDLVQQLAVDAYRFSVAWGRVIHPDGSINQAGVDFYLGILAKLQQYQIKAFVTLYHWDLPQYLEDQGGWLNRQTAYRFRDYVDLISQAFGDKVYSYATLNEPFCSAYLGYEIGIHAPGITGVQYGKKAAHHLLLAHGLAMQVLAKNSPDSQNGIVLNFTPAYSHSADPADQAAAKLADAHHNHWYIKPVIEGQYPALIDQLPADQKPDIQPGDMAIIYQPLDYIGVNYYTRAIYSADNSADNSAEQTQGFQQQPPKDVPLTAMGWEIYPQGLTDLLLGLHQDYQLPPIYITENGAAMNDQWQNGAVNDTDRIDYFQRHLLAVDQAIEQGVNIQGYFAWSLMDNFEWALGYQKRFGIVYVDYPSQTRTIKASGYAYQQLIQQRAKSKSEPEQS